MLTPRLQTLKDNRKTGRHKHRLRKPGAKIKKKTVYRIRAKDMKDRLAFLKLRTKNPETTIQRFLTLKGLKADRITR